MRPPDVDHLYYDGRHYDAAVQFRQDIAFWIGQAKRYGDPILELACGTGRVAIPLAKAGYRVTGLDASTSMLAQARRRSAEEGVSVEWLHGDVRDFGLGKQFPVVIFPFNAICHLRGFEDLEACLTCVKRHLRPDGRFILSEFNPRLDILLRSAEERYPHTQYVAPDDGGTIVVTENNVYDSATQINHVKLCHTWPGSREEVVEELNMRIYYPQELDALLKYNGLRIEAKLGDYDGAPFASASPYQVIVCSASPVRG
jgi:ubiquinone/menaquinone biosynthesis C-methylase UbiE